MVIKSVFLTSWVLVRTVKSRPVLNVTVIRALPLWVVASDSLFICKVCVLHEDKKIFNSVYQCSSDLLGKVTRT